MTDISPPWSRWKISKVVSFSAKCRFFSTKTDKTSLHMDKKENACCFLNQEGSSHLLPNLTAHDRARKYPKCTFYMDDELMFCSSISCNIVKYSVMTRRVQLIFNYCLQGERLFCYILFKLVLLLWDQMWVWQISMYCWGFKTIQDALKSIFYNLVNTWLYNISLRSTWLIMDWIRESSFNMTRGDEDIEGGLRKFLHTWGGGSEKIVGLREGLWNFYYQRGGKAPKKLNH